MGVPIGRYLILPSQAKQGSSRAYGGEETDGEMTQNDLYPLPIKALYPRIHQKGGSKAETSRKAVSRLSLCVRKLALLTHLRDTLHVDTSVGPAAGRG